MPLTDNQARIAAAMGVSVGDMNIAEDLTLQAIDAGMEAMTRVARLHHNLEMQGVTLAAAAMAIARGAASSTRAAGNFREIMLIRLLMGELDGPVSVSRPRESAGDDK